MTRDDHEGFVTGGTRSSVVVKHAGAPELAALGGKRLSLKQPQYAPASDVSILGVRQNGRHRWFRYGTKAVREWAQSFWLAGRSTRMGEAKQLLHLGESTVLEQTLGNVRDAAIDEIVLVLGSSAETIRQQLPIPAVEGLKVVVNQSYSLGMAISLRAGLSALDPHIDAALIVLADQPFVRHETLDRIVDQHLSSGAQIVIPMYKGFRGNPVLLDRSVFPEVMALDGDIWLPGDLWEPLGRNR